MQVLQICHSYYPPFLDCARQVSVLFDGVEHEVITIYLTGKSDEAVARETASNKVIFLEYASHEVRGLKFGAIAKVRKIIKDYRFSFCIAHRVKPTYVALLASSLPVISIHHNYNDYARRSRRWFINFYKHRLLMLGVSDSVRDDLRRDLKGWVEDRIQTLYNHIDIPKTQSQMLPKSAARQFLGISDSSFVIANVGRLHHDKDQATLILGFYKALNRLPTNSILVIMGDGPLGHNLKQQVIDLNIQEKVLFTGKIPNGKQLFKAFDVFALTSDHEPFGMVLLEAMAAGLPIICSDCGGGAEVVRDVGELFPLGNANALADCLIRSSVSKEHMVIPKKLSEKFSDESARFRFWKLLSDINFLNMNKL